MASDSVSDIELTDLRSDAESWLDLTCDIERNTPSTNAWGAATDAYAAIATGVACGLARPSQAMLTQYAARIGTQRTWLVSLPYGTDIAETDHLVLSTQTLLVQVALEPMSYATLTQVLASEVP